MKNLDQTRRRFMAHFAGAGLGATLAPGILWARTQEAGTQRVTWAMVTDVPFNWNARFDVRKLKAGIIRDSFDDISNASAKANAQKTLDTWRSLGVTPYALAFAAMPMPSVSMPIAVKVKPGCFARRRTL